MTYNDIIYGVLGLCEQRPSNLISTPPAGAPAGIAATISTWLDAEIYNIINRKRYFWRRKNFSFPLLASTSSYDLSKDVSPKLPDFEQIENIYYAPVAGRQKKLDYVSNQDEVQRLMNDGLTGQPKKYFQTNGNILSITFDPTPDQAYPIQGSYWATYVNPGDNAQPIPLVPTQFHYVVMMALLMRVMFYLFGENDPRYTAAKQELMGEGTMVNPGGSLKKLDDFTGFSVEEQQSRPAFAAIDQPVKQEYHEPDN